MPPSTMRSAIGLLCIVLGLAACGDRPERISADSPEPQAPAAAAPSQGPRFAGTVVLEGSLAAAQSGAVFVSARRKGQRLPTLSKKFEWNDPAWSTEEGRRELRFALTQADNMGGFGAPMGPDMEVEARYSPSGFIDTRPGNDEAGSVRASVPATIGDASLTIRLQPTPGK